MAQEYDKQKAEVHDLAKTYLAKHDELTPEEKQALFKELEHQQKRLSKLKQPRSNNEEERS